jgi:hypothetical protein
MKNHLAAAQSLIHDRDFAAARTELSNIRPGQQGTIETLRMWTLFHSSQDHWGNVDVLCKVIRQDYPSESFGFEEGAESLHRQGRSSEAINLLKQFETGLNNDPGILYRLARYHCAMDNLLGATMLLGTAFSRDLRLRDKAFSDGELKKVWPALEEDKVSPTR